MSTSDRRWGDAGASGPFEAWTADIESSTVTRCSRPPVRSFSLRPSTGRISASRPVTTCDRLSLVETWTVRSACRMASSVTSVSDIAETKLPPMPMKTFASPSRSARTALTLSWPCSRGRVEAELVAQRVEEVVGHPLPDPHRAVALHVGVAADRAQPGARLADVALGQRDVGDLLDRRDRVAVLGDAHRPADDGRRGVAEHLRRLPDQVAVEPGRAAYGVPVERRARERPTPRSRGRAAR